MFLDGVLISYFIFDKDKRKHNCYNWLVQGI